MIVSLETSIFPKPKVGEIHTARIRMISLFGSESVFDSTGENQLKSSTSSSSSKNSDDRPPKRPILIWKTIPTIQVLVMSRFSGVNVADPNIRLFNHLTSEYVLKRLVPVFPKMSYGGKRSIAAITFKTGEQIKTIDTNLILIPITLPKKWRCKGASEFFPPKELFYVNEILRQISIEDSEEQNRYINAIDYSRGAPPGNYTNNDDDTSSSTSSSIPKPRSAFVADIYWEKHSFLHQWLDRGESK